MRRSAFTLLEVLCSLAISVLLLGALYVAVNVQLQSTQSAREVLEHSSLVRTLLARIHSDISANLGPVPPDPRQAAATGTTSGTTTPTAATPTTAGTTPPTGGGATETSSLLGPVQFNLGVQGDSERLTLYISRIHRDARFLPEPSAPDAMLISSDLRRVTYWLVGGIDAPQGLARQVVRLVTSEDLMSALPPNISDETSYILADEVRSLRFSYFDGSAWQDSWDGQALGADGTSQIGPPLAIAITIGIARKRDGNGDGHVKEYRHVVAIPTANGASQQTTESP